MIDIARGKPQLGWELYLKMETSGESFNLLQIIGNDCYKVIKIFSELVKLKVHD